jgi:hypothetical protein
MRFRRRKHLAVVELLGPDNETVGEPLLVPFRKRGLRRRSRRFENTEPVVFSHLPEGAVTGFALYDMETGDHRIGHLGGEA